jgi:hypothetical protein
MLSLIEQASAKCPSTELVIAGYRYLPLPFNMYSYLLLRSTSLKCPFVYSQGAQLVHNSATKLSAAITAQVVAGKDLLSSRISLLPPLVPFKNDTNANMPPLPSSRNVRRPRPPPTRRRHPRFRSRLHLPRPRHHLYRGGRFCDASDLWHGCRQRGGFCRRR